MKPNINVLQQKLSKIEKKLEKVRGCSPLTHGWQTKKYAKASKDWDYYSVIKMQLIQEIDCCNSENPDDMCSNCNCWKQTRTSCS